MGEQNIRVIYIAGYGHSGSTILEMLLSTPQGVLGLGELSEIGNKSIISVDDNIRRSCKRYYDRIQQKLNGINETWESTVDTVRCEHLFGRKNHQEIMRYQQFWRTFFLAAAEVDGNRESVFVDSSKCAVTRAYRPILLQEIECIDVTCIHLIRSPMPILTRGQIKEKKRKRKFNRGKVVFTRVLSLACHWVFSNLWSVCLARRCDRYVRLSYEQLCDDPEGTLTRLGNCTGLDMAEAIRRVKQNEPLQHTCGLAGNRIMLQAEVRFQPASPKEGTDSTTVKIFSLILQPIYKILTRNCL